MLSSVNFGVFDADALFGLAIYLARDITLPIPGPKTNCCPVSGCAGVSANETATRPMPPLPR